MTYTGHVLNGQLVFDGPPPPEGRRFTLAEDVPPESGARRIPTLAERFGNLLGAAGDLLPPDAGVRHDAYIRAEAARK